MTASPMLTKSILAEPVASILNNHEMISDK